MSFASGLRDDVKLYSHQDRAVNKVKQQGNLLLSHGTGSGKTLSAIASFEKMRDEGGATTALVVTPASLRVNFIDNGVKKFTNGRASMIGNSQEVSGGLARSIDDPDRGARYHVVSYEMFMKDPEKVLKNTGADTVIYDELHRIRNEAGVTYGKIREARKHHKNFIGLTGSLMNNTPADLVPLVDAMTDGNHRLGTKKQFESRFVHEDKKGKKTVSNPRVVRGLLNPYIDHFETKQMDADNVPKRVVEEVKVMMSPHQEELYRYAVGKMDPITALKFRFGVSNLKKRDIHNIFSKITQARQISNSIHTMDKDVSLSDAAKHTPKVKQLLDDVEDHLKETPDGQVVLHSNFINGGVDVLSQGLKDRNISFGTFVGKGQKGVTEAKRQKDVEDFNAGKKKALVISAAGGEGLDLRNSTFFGSLDGHFNPEKVQQAEARAVRAGGQSHRAPEDRKVIIRRYQSVVPRSITQTAKDTLSLISPAGFLKRLTEPETPLFYNPFKREQSPDEWMASVAKDKDLLNETLREQLRKTSSMDWYIGSDQDLEKLSSHMCRLVEYVAFEEELSKIAAVQEGEVHAQRIPHQPFRYIKSDKHIMDKYWEDFGDEVENMNNPGLGELSSYDKKVKEQQYINDLREYYRAAIKGSGKPPKNVKTDSDWRKHTAKIISGVSGIMGGSGAVSAAAEFSRAGYPFKEALLGGLTIGGIGTLATALGGGIPYVYSARKSPHFTTAKTQARKASKFDDEQLRSMLRGLSVRKEEVKRTEHYIG